MEKTLAAILIAGIVGVAIYAFARDEPPEKRFFGVLLFDASLSSNRDACEGIDHISRKILRMAPNVSLKILASGTAETGEEPVQIGSIEVARGHRVLEGRGQDDAREKEIVEQLRSLCSKVPRHHESPLFRAVQTAVNYLHDAPCASENVSCAVLYSTDGLETSDSIIRRGSSSVTRKPRISNSNIDVIFCDLSSRRTRRGERVPDLAAVEASFRPEFTDPSRVSFSPACASFAN